MTARDRRVLMVVAALAAVAAGWLFLIAPERNQASKLSDQVSSAQSQLSTAQAAVAAGEQARASFASSYTAMARLGQAVPADDEVPSLILQVQDAASASRVDFQSLALGSTASGSTPAASGSAAQAATAALPPGVAVGTAGFPTEPFTFTFNGSFFRLSDFLGRLEHFVVATDQRISVSGRLLSLNGINLGSGPGGFPNVTATVAATTYVLPATQGVLAGATPGGPPASSPGTQVSAGSGSSSLAPATIAGGGR